MVTCNAEVKVRSGRIRRDVGQPAPDRAYSLEAGGSTGAGPANGQICANGPRASLAVVHIVANAPQEPAPFNALFPFAAEPREFPAGEARGDAGRDGCAGVPDIVLEGEPESPPFGRYETDRFVLSAAALAVGFSLHSGDSAYIDVGTLMLGPCLARQLKASGDVRSYGAQPVWTVIRAPSGRHLIEGAVIRRRSNADGIERFWQAVRGQVIADDGFRLRCARANELDWYCRIVPYDVADPVIVISSIDHEYFLHRVRGNLWYLDDYQNLRWEA